MKIIINAVIGSLIIGYFFGCINFSYIVSRIKGFDIRKFGSGNAGASNVVIVIGKKAGLFVALVDIFKAFLAYKLAQYLFPDAYLNGVSYAGMIAGVGAVLGHIFPFYLGFLSQSKGSSRTGREYDCTELLVSPLFFRGTFSSVFL